MVNRVNAAFDDMKGSENTGGTENPRGLEHMSTAENTGESLMRSLLPPDICVAETTGDFGHLRDAEREYFASAVSNSSMLGKSRWLVGSSKISSCGSFASMVMI